MSAKESGFQISGDAPRYYQDHVALIMRPFVDALVAASVRPGDAVLDVACGTGFAARAAAEAVGVGGSVVGADINGGMLAMAASAPHASPCTIEWCEASALALPMESDTFDAVLCQQGLQFVPDPAAALAEMARVTRPGGRVGVTVWAPIELSPYMDAHMDVLMGACDQDDQVVRQAFPPGGEEALRDWFSAAALPEVRIATLAPRVTLPPIREYAPAHFRALPWAGPFFALDPPARDALLAGMADALSPFAAGDGTVEVPFTSLCATVVI